MDRPTFKSIWIAQAVRGRLLMKKKKGIEVGDSWGLDGGRASKSSGVG